MFKAPIQLLNECNTLTSQTIDDLQLDILYNDILGKEEEKSVREIWTNHFTTNTAYLKNTQTLLKKGVFNNQEYKRIKGLFREIKDNPSFREKYEYITVEFFEAMNTNPHMLQLISMYSLTSPLLSLLIPFIMLVIPFFILRVRGSTISMSAYLTELKKVLSMLPIGKLFDLKNISMDQRGFVLFSVILYFVQIYQNSITCYKFYKNSHKMVNELHEIANYNLTTADRMEQVILQCKTLQLDSYIGFSKVLEEKVTYLREMADQFLAIQSNVFKDMGLKMKYYFDLYSDNLLEETMNYTFGFHEYIDNLNTLSDAKLSNCTFSKKHSTLTNCYHGILRSENPIKNSVKLTEKNIILSGPNASGKTTLLKSTAINIILSQQIGMGFYDKAKIYPYHHFHCYINIPDTCDRDSLFQAEARRCRNIISKVNGYSDDRHLCIFDELFSGTNPYEAVASAIGYLEYLNKNKKVRFILTTHYLDLCKHFGNGKSGVENYTLEKKYTMNLGISKVRGGITVLEELEFPEEILNTAKKTVSLN
jgi:hypothetical protein